MNGLFTCTGTRRFIALVAACGVWGSAAAQSFPETVLLPNGFQPEGIAIGHGTTAYVGSLLDGSIYTVDLRTGAGETLLQGPGSGAPAVGLAFDKRTGYLFVAGGSGGDVRVYDTTSGQLTAQVVVPMSSFVNDVAVTRNAAFFTDSLVPVIYRLPLDSQGQPSASAQSVQLSGDFEFVPNAINANGIVATPDNETLVVVNSSTGRLYRVEPDTGIAIKIDLGGDTVLNGDGLVLEGNTLYVVQSLLNQIAVFSLSPDLSEATLTRLITDDDFRVPSTADRFGPWLYAVNARFGDSIPGVPNNLEFEIIRVE